MTTDQNAVNRDSTPLHLENLNQPQLDAVTHLNGPILILAGAGSGKTRVLTRRVAHLISEHRVSPGKILAVTFTNKATREMYERLGTLLGQHSSRLWVSTFHSAGLRILRRHADSIGYKRDFVVYDSQDSKTLIRQILKSCDIDEKQYSWRDFQACIDRCKNNFVSPEEFAQSINTKNMNQSFQAEVYDRYQKELLHSNAMDFGDLLFNAVRLFKERPEILRAYQDQLDYILVDEFQDTNMVQYTLIKQLCGTKKNLFVVGDDDQSIYAFRGASVANILEFERDFPGTFIVKLEQNYRSTTCILEASHAIIAKNKNRRDKKLWTESGFGDPIGLFSGNDEADEAAFIADRIQQYTAKGKSYSDAAIFYRTNAQSRSIEEALMDAGIPYRIYGGLKFYDRKEIKDIVAFLRLLVNEADNQAFLRVVNTPPRGIGPQKVKAIADHARQNHLSLLSAAREIANSNKHIQAFVELMGSFKAEANTISVGDLIALIVEKSEYGPKLKAMKDITAESRLENLKELEGVARSFEVPADSQLELLRLFLDRISLTSSDELPVEDGADGEAEKLVDAVSLMTLHLAKGLEYPIVFFSGFEEGLVPHKRSIDEPGGIAEERRLCYVGMTRAIEKLYLTRAKKRAMFSSGDSFGFSGAIRKPSRYAMDIPPACFDARDPQTDRFFHDETYIASEEFDVPFDTGVEFSGFKKKSTSAATRVRKKKTAISGLVGTADALAKKDLTEGLERAELVNLKVGMRVVHPSFGAGEIKKIDEASGSDSLKSKLLIKFERFDSPKKVVFKFANLALPAGE